MNKKCSFLKVVGLGLIAVGGVLSAVYVSECLRKKSAKGYKLNKTNITTDNDYEDDYAEDFDYDKDYYDEDDCNNNTFEEDYDEATFEESNLASRVKEKKRA